MRNLEQKRAYDLQSEVVRAESGFAAARTRSLELGSILSAAAAEASATSEAIFNASSATYSIRELRERLTAINNRIDDCQLEAKASVKLVFDARAVNPTVPASNPKAKALVGGFGIAYGCALLCCVGFELLDGRLRSRSDMAAALGGDAPDPVLAMSQSHSQGVADRDTVGREVTHSIDSLASRIERERMAHGSKVILLMGVHHGTGTSFIARRLAVALSDYSDRVLLIQTSVNHAPGTDIQGATNADANEVITIELTSPRLTGAASGLGRRIRAARETFDFVILDADPISTEPFTRFAVLHSDAVVLVAKAGVTLFQELAVSLEEVRRSPIGALTALLNFAPDVKRVGMQRRIQSGIGLLSAWAKRMRVRIEKLRS